MGLPGTGIRAVGLEALQLSHLASSPVLPGGQSIPVGISQVLSRWCPRRQSPSYPLYILRTASGEIDGHSTYGIVEAFISKNYILHYYIEFVHLTHRTPELMCESGRNHRPHNALDTPLHSAYHSEYSECSTSDSGWHLMADHLF